MIFCICLFLEIILVMQGFSFGREDTGKSIFLFFVAIVFFLTAELDSLVLKPGIFFFVFCRCQRGQWRFKELP